MNNLSFLMVVSFVTCSQVLTVYSAIIDDESTLCGLLFITANIVIWAKYLVNIPKVGQNAQIFLRIHSFYECIIK